MKNLSFLNLLELVKIKNTLILQNYQIFEKPITKFLIKIKVKLDNHHQNHTQMCINAQVKALISESPNKNSQPPKLQSFKAYKCLDQ